jgi:hypothetical protein
VSQVAGKRALVSLCCWAWAFVAAAQQPEVHYLHNGVMPPGAIGGQRLQRGGPLSGFFQPVVIEAPSGAMVSMAVHDQFDAGQAVPRRAGLLIGAVYRLRVTNIPLAEGMEVFPTIELIDRLYTPPEQQLRFAIPVQLTAEELGMALEGKFVTRVIYLEDPHRALPTSSASQAQTWFEVGRGQDPLVAATGLGRPVAILRLGGRLPTGNADASFFCGSPPFVQFTPQGEMPKPRKPAVPPAAAK